jgi:hypothetical protein
MLRGGSVERPRDWGGKEGVERGLTKVVRRAPARGPSGYATRGMLRAIQSRP